MPQNYLENETVDLEDQIRRDISLEIFRAAKVPNIGWLRKLISPLVRNPVNHFSKLIVEFDTSIRYNGYVYASTQILKKTECRFSTPIR